MIGGPLRAGLVGCGVLAQIGILPHLSQPDARERVRLVALADTVAERARECAERFDVPAHFTSLEAMLAGAELDLVLLATPVHAHFAQAMAAVAAGKHVYVQKSMTATLAEADALLAARDRAGVKLAAAPGYEQCTTTVALRRAVRRGVLGRVYVAYAYTLGFGAGREPAPGARDPLAEIDPSWLYRAGGGGPLPHITVYSLQLLTSVLGPARRVTMLANRLKDERRWRDKVIPVEIDDNNLLVLEFAGGALATAVGASARGGRRTPWGGLSLHGDAGALEVTEVHHASGYPLRFEVDGGRWAEDGAGELAGRAYAAALADQPYLTGAHLTLPEPHVYADIMDLVDAVREDRPPRATGEQARHVVEIIERALLSARTGQAQALSSAFDPPTDGEEAG